jgi:DNA-directed RNA polymerase subunit RPC12/RpoP
VIVRCGRCGTSFDVVGEGRVACPRCGTVNEVKRRPVEQELVSPPPPAPEPVPSPRVTCPECGFRFIVGAVVAAPCPNCGAEVKVEDGKGG